MKHVPPRAMGLALLIVIATSAQPVGSIVTASDGGTLSHAAPNLSPLGGLAALPVISRGAPAYTNDDCNGSAPAALAADEDYATLWRSCAASPSAARPIWLAYQLAAVPAARRARVLVAWYNDPKTSPYDHGLINDRGYNIP